MASSKYQNSMQYNTTKSYFISVGLTYISFETSLSPDVDKTASYSQKCLSLLRMIIDVAKIVKKYNFLISNFSYRKIEPKQQDSYLNFNCIQSSLFFAFLISVFFMQIMYFYTFFHFAVPFYTKISRPYCFSLVTLSVSVEGI